MNFTKTWKILIAALYFLVLTTFSHAERVTIRYLTFETSYQQIGLIKKIIAEFEKKHPDIHVQLEATTEASRVFLTDMADGTPPDVMLPAYHYYNWLERNKAMTNPHIWWGCPESYDVEAPGFIMSLGPSQNFVGGYQVYDPSNGTVSIGYISRIFPGGEGSR